MAIVKDTMTSKLTDNMVYFEGHYFLGLTKAFQEYPSRAIEMYLPTVSVTSADNLGVVLDISCQYKLNPEQIFTLYAKYSQTYEAIFENKVKDVVLEEAVKWDTQPDFYVERVAIARDMEKALIRKFNESNAELLGFQLRKVDLPDSLEDAIVDTVVAAQLTTTTTIEQSATLTRTQASNVESEADAEIEEIDATATATGTLIEAAATAEKTKLMTKARADALLYTARALNLTKAQMFEIMWQKAVAQNPSINRASVGFDDTTMIDNLVTDELAIGR